MISLIFKIYKLYFNILKWFWIELIILPILMMIVNDAFILIGLIADLPQFIFCFWVCQGSLFISFTILEILWFKHLKTGKSKKAARKKLIDELSALEHSPINNFGVGQRPVSTPVYSDDCQEKEKLLFSIFKKLPDMKLKIISLRNEPQYQGYSDDEILKDICNTMVNIEEQAVW